MTAYKFVYSVASCGAWSAWKNYSAREELSQVRPGYIKMVGVFTKSISTWTHQNDLFTSCLPNDCLFEVYVISLNQSHSAALLRSKLSFCRFIDDSYRWYDVNEGYTARAVCKIQNCPQGFIEYNNKCLRVVNSRRNRWAEYYCKIFMKKLLNSIHYITNT